jgi:hypothetical protein
VIVKKLFLLASMAITSQLAIPRLCPAAVIKGTVTDSLNGEAVNAALVKVKGATDSAFSDTAGRFVLNTFVGIGLGRAGIVATEVLEKIPADALVTVYGPNGTGLASGRSAEMSAWWPALPNGMYLFKAERADATYTGKVVKIGAHCRIDLCRDAIPMRKAGAAVTLVFNHWHYSAKELAVTEGDTNLAVPLAPKKGWELDETNTGLAGAGVDKNSLPIYNGTVYYGVCHMPPAGTTISLKKIVYPIILKNGNITLDRCWIQPTVTLTSGGLILTFDSFGLGSPAPSKSCIRDCDIDGSLVTDYHIYYSAAIAGGGYHLLWCNIHGMGSGIVVHSTGQAFNCLIQNNYVHDLRASGGAYNDHHEAATIRGFDGTSLLWRNNRLASRTGWDSAAFFIQANQHITCATLTGNLFDTIGYNDLVLEYNAGGYDNAMAATNNRFLYTIGYGGPGYVSGGPGWAQWTENYYDNPANPDHKGAAIAKP